MKFKKLKEDEIIATDDFWYDLFYGGYIDPEKLLVHSEDIEKVKEAIEVLKEFEEELNDNDLIYYV
jgi:hypothetical protein